MSDWSADVCSSDLCGGGTLTRSTGVGGKSFIAGRLAPAGGCPDNAPLFGSFKAPAVAGGRHEERGQYENGGASTRGRPRSDERRGGKECVSTGRSRW